MILNNEFVVDAPAEQVWDLLMDFERMAACMPGATYRGRAGDDINGSVQIKVGPITANFEGTARFLEQDPARHTAVVAASGKDPRGQATANATITARLEPQGDQRTRVLVDTDLAISGRIAQFGRGAIADVAARIIAQFTENLHEEVLAGKAATEPAGSAAPTAGVAAGSVGAAPGSAGPRRTAESSDLDLIAVVGPMVLRRAGIPLVSAVVGGLVGWLVGRRSRGRDSRCCSTAG